MKTIDFDSKITAVKEQFTKDVPKASLPVVKTAVDLAKMKVVIKIISNELLKDPVLVSLMTMKNDPTPQSIESFLTVVKDKIDYATRLRYKQMLDETLVEEKKNDQTV